MSGTLRSPPQAPAADVGATVSDAPRRGLGWSRLQAMAAAVTIASIAIPMTIEGQVAGFLVAMAAPFVIGLAVVRLLPRAAAIFLGVVSVATLAFSTPYIAQALTHPESATDFVPQTFFMLSLIIAAVAAIPAYRQPRGDARTSRAPRLIAVAAGLVAAVAAVISIAVATGVDNMAAQPGDQTVLARDFAFAPAKVTAEAGTISVHLTNEDSTRHTFTIDGLTDLSVPPNTTQRVTFDAAPGTYRYYCRPHDPGMDGVLIVQ